MAMRIRLAVPDGLNDDEAKAVLDSALEAVTRAQTPLLARGLLPSAARAIRAGRVRWRPEPPGDEHFDLAGTVLRRGWGDCDDLAPWHAASLRASGQDPEAQAEVRKSGPHRWHAIVRRSDGSIEDPSEAAGMGGVGGDEYRGPFWRPMFDDRLSLVAAPLAHGWAGRVDIPSENLPMMYSGLSRGRTPAQAIVGAARCAHLVYDDANPLDLARVTAIQDLLQGCSPAVVGEALDHIGFGFLAPLLAPAAMNLAAPLVSKMLPGILPGGASSPAAATSAATPGGGGAIYPGMAGTPGTSIHVPGGPIIVRF